MTHFLPPSLLALFAPRPPIKHLDWSTEVRSVPITGVSEYLSAFEDPSTDPPPDTHTFFDSKEARKKSKIDAKAEANNTRLQALIEEWDPQNNTDAANTNPYKTLFVSRLSYATSEVKLKREFEIYGPIKNIHIVEEKGTNKPRGYAFIEFEAEEDMQKAYMKADGCKIDGKRILVDVERGRTVRNWRPRRLGGGLGGTRLGGKDVNQTFSGREPLKVRDDDRRDKRGGDRSRGFGRRDGRDTRDRYERHGYRDRDRGDRDSHRDRGRSSHHHRERSRSPGHRRDSHHRRSSREDGRDSKRRRYD